MNRTEPQRTDTTPDRVFLSVIRDVPADMTAQLGTESQTQREPMVLRLPSQDGIRGRRMSVLQQILEQLEPLRKVACVAIIFGLMANTVFAQGDDGTYVIGGEYSGSASRLNVPENPGVGGMGVLGRIGHEAGDTIGRTESLTSFDIQPFMFFEETMLFGEGRLFLVNSGRVGGSAGLGLRHFFMNKNTIGGLEFFYDRDDSRGEVFEQFGVSTEIFTEWLDIRGNVYMPIGKKEQVLGTVFAAGTERFINNNIQFQTATTTADAMEGGDLMFTVPIPGEIPQKVNLETSAGFYHYQSRGKDTAHVYGYKLRADVDLFDRLSHMFCEVSNDGTFGTNVVFGADVNYRGDQESRPRLGKSQYNRISQWVRRNRHVVAQESTNLDAPQLAINPQTGVPYVVYHVRNNPTPPPPNFPAPLGDGSIDTPFQFMNEAIDELPFGDIVFVHGNSVFDASVIANVNATAVLRENLLVLGEGVPLTIPTLGIIDEIPLPRATTGPVNRPLITNVTGPVVTLADNSRFAGFTITDVDGPVIFGNSVNGSILNEINILVDDGVNTGNGIELSNNSGLFSLENINVSSVMGNALQVTGGTANIVFDGTNTIVDPNGFAVFVQDAAGSINMRGTAITADGTTSGTGNGGLGILVQGTGVNTSRANVTIGSANFTNTNPVAALPAILVDNHAGTVSFLGDVSIDSNNGNGIEVRELASTGSVSFQGNTSILNRNAIGVFIPSINEGPDVTGLAGFRSGNVTFQQDLNVTGFLAGTVAPAVQFDSPTGLLNLVGNTTINGSGGNGFEVSSIADVGTTQGQVVSSGVMRISSTAGNAFEVNTVAKSNFLLNTNGILVDNRAQVGINFSNYAGTARLFGVNLISNQLGTTTSGIVVEDNTGDIGFGDTSVTNTVGGAGTIGVRVNRNAADPLAFTEQAEVGFSRLSVDGFADLGVQITQNESVSTGGGILDIATGQAIDVLLNGQVILPAGTDLIPGVNGKAPTGHSLIFEEVSATLAPSGFGIRVLDSNGQFVVTGGGQFDGGTISGMTIAGALFQDTQVADLNFQTYQGNNVGIRAVRLNQRTSTRLLPFPDLTISGINGRGPFLGMSNMDIQGSVNQGVSALDVLDVRIIDSALTNNGDTNGNNQIRIDYLNGLVDVDRDGIDEEPLQFSVLLDNNVLSDPAASNNGSDMVLLNVLPAFNGDQSTLDLVVTNNGTPPNGVGFVGSRAGASILNVNWRGAFLDATIQNNVFLLNNTLSQTAVEMFVDGLSQVLIDNNAISAQGINATGLELSFSEATNLDITNSFQRDVDGNLIQNSGFAFAETGSTAIDLTFNGTDNDINIDSNLIQFGPAAFVGDGIIFRRIFGPSNVNINTNQIEFPFLSNNNIFFVAQQRGIAFLDVRGTISLNGSDDNVIDIDFNNPLATDFQINGQSTGSIIINGSPRP